MLENPIEKRRKELKISRKKLAEKLDIHYTTLFNIEKGRVNSVNDKVLDYLKEKGYDRKNIVNDYKKYKKKKRENIMKDINN